MGRPTEPGQVMLIVAAFSRYPAALDWARARTAEAWGPIALESPIFPFEETDYYKPTMGSDLKKVFFACQPLIDPGTLAQRKLCSNAWEEHYARQALYAEPRPLNLDPGYITLGKLVLASTKDFAHRIYLGQGIYAEVTLYYKHGQWQSHSWTFADYRRPEYHAFFSQCREALHRRLREVGRCIG